MREIKFRAWNKTNNSMVPVEAIEFIDALEGRPGVLTAKHGKWVSKWLDSGEYELMQFTGLLDRNGKEIYEGDVVMFHNGDTGFIDCEEWLEFFFNWIGEPKLEDQTRDFYRIGKGEVIGNIYENPELLK